MKPDENSSSQGGTPLLSQRSLRDTQKTRLSAPARAAAAKILLKKVNEVIDKPNDPYNQTQTDSTELRTDDWKQYHSAWQDYYQKYYEGYYSHHLKKATDDIANKQSGPYFELPPDKVAADNAMAALRQQLTDKVRQSATKVRKSRHFIPIISAVIVVLVFLFLQYNRVLISNVVAYISPGNIDPQNIVIDPSSNISVSPEPRLIIPKINVDVPVMYDVGNDYDSQMAAMVNGVAHFAIPGANSHPGQIGNTAIAGHSSNDLLDSGDYKFIFAQLEKLAVGDTIYANYKSKRYTYTVTKTEVVSPTDVSKLVYPTTKPILTLITCTPLGTSTNRLLVTAEQVSPDPAQSASAPSSATTADNSSIPGNSPTLLERLFGTR